MTSDTQIEEQSQITELSIGADGRVYVFGLSRKVLEILAVLQPDDSRVQQLLRRVEDNSMPAVDHTKTARNA